MLNVGGCHIVNVRCLYAVLEYFNRWLLTGQYNISSLISPAENVSDYLENKPLLNKTCNKTCNLRDHLCL